MNGWNVSDLRKEIDGYKRQLAEIRALLPAATVVTTIPASLSGTCPLCGQEADCGERLRQIGEVVRG